MGSPSLGAVIDRAKARVEMGTKDTAYSSPTGSFTCVRVKIPRLSQNLRDVPAHTFQAEGKDIAVQPHYELYSCPLGQGGWVQQNFYGFDESDLGKIRTAEVVAIKKFSKGKEILLLDITKVAEGLKAETVMKVTPKRPWDLAIPFGGGIRFVPVQQGIEE